MREALLSWFDENAHDLPWRRTRDPWRILVSEVMLQRIQVKRAIPFYERFLARFPTVEALAGAPLSDAIRAWGDRGRYRRVVNLHRTARIVVDEHGGEVPSDPDVLLKLPGIGPYTAGAVACFAFERDVGFATPGRTGKIVRGLCAPRAKIFGPAKPLLSGVGDRQPERRTPVVPQRRCSWLVVDLPLHRSLPPTRGATACPRL